MPERLGPSIQRRLYPYLYRLLYHELAWSYDLVSNLVSLGRWDRWRRAGLAYVIGDRILEIGFGTGHLLPELGQREGFGVGLEPSAAMQQLVLDRLGPGPYPARVQGIVQSLPFADATFDSVLATFPAGYILDPRTFLEVARVLNPGGRLIVVDMILVDPSPILRLLGEILFPAPPQRASRTEELVLGAGLSIRHEVVGRGRSRSMVTLIEKPAEAEDGRAAQPRARI